MPSYETVSFSLRTLWHIVHAVEHGVLAVSLPDIQDRLLHCAFPLDGIEVREQVVALAAFIANILECNAELSDLGVAVRGLVIRIQRGFDDERGKRRGDANFARTV